MKIYAMGVFAAALASGAGMALADPPADPNNNGQGTHTQPASSSGSTHGAFADDNGNFGFLGEVGGTPGYHGGATGQDVGATGYNNSHVDEPPVITHK